MRLSALISKLQKGKLANQINLRADQTPPGHPQVQPVGHLQQQPRSQGSQPSGWDLISRSTSSQRDPRVPLPPPGSFTCSSLTVLLHRVDYAVWHLASITSASKMGNKQALSKQCSLLSGESAGQPVLTRVASQHKCSIPLW